MQQRETIRRTQEERNTDVARAMKGLQTENTDSNTGDKRQMHRELAKMRKKEYIENIFKMGKLASEIEELEDKLQKCQSGYLGDDPNKRDDDSKNTQAISKEKREQSSWFNDGNGDDNENINAHINKDNNHEEAALDDDKQESIVNLNATEVKKQSIWDTPLTVDVQKQSQPIQEEQVKEVKQETKSIWSESLVNTKVDNKEQEKIIQEKLIQARKEMEAIKEQIAAMRPKVSGFLGYIHDGDKTEELIRRGIIAGEGQSYEGQKQLLDIVDKNRVSEEADKQWIKADAIFNEVYDYICMEVYMDAICAIYEDGSVDVYR